MKAPQNFYVRIWSRSGQLLPVSAAVAYFGSVEKNEHVCCGHHSFLSVWWPLGSRPSRTVSLLTKNSIWLETWLSSAMMKQEISTWNHSIPQFRIILNEDHLKKWIRCKNLGKRSIGKAAEHSATPTLSCGDPLQRNKACRAYDPLWTKCLIISPTLECFQHHFSSLEASAMSQASKKLWSRGHAVKIGRNFKVVFIKIHIIAA